MILTLSIDAEQSLADLPTVSEGDNDRTGASGEWRHDGVAKVTGAARYSADIELPGMLYAEFVYARRSRARIRSIDTSATRRLTGVMAVLTQADLPDVRYGLHVKDRTLMARDEVRFEGEVVAAVAATTTEIAREACSLIEVEYEALEPVIDAERALTDASPLVHEQWASFQTLPGMVRQGNSCAYTSVERGDPDVAMAAADINVTERFDTDMAHPVPIEPRAVVAAWEGEKVTIWSSTQVPYVAREGVAETLQIPQRNVRVIVPHLGGGFGGKCVMHIEPHVAALARAAGRPVRAVYDRAQEFLAPDMRHHPLTVDVTTGLRFDGTIVARRVRMTLDTGPYSGHGPFIAEIATMLAVGPYRVPNLNVGAHAVYTNHGPSGSVRAPSSPQVCWAIEQHTDSLAAACGLSPLEFRMLNLVEDGDIGPTGQVLSAVGVKECLRRAAELIEWERGTDAGEGIGLSVSWWGNYPMASGATVSLNVDGSLTVVTGANENGSGATVGLRILAARELQLPTSEVAIVYQDTDNSTPDHGSGGSQTTFNNGRAVVQAASKVRERLLELGAEHLGCEVSALELAEGMVRVADSTDERVSFAELALAASFAGEYVTASAAPRPRPTTTNDIGSSQGRTVIRSFVAPSFLAHAARVRVDTATGAVRAEHVAAVHDFGTVINPVGARGQVTGGVVHGLGIALIEGTVHDETGRMINAHLLDYKLMTASDAPRISVDFVDRPSQEGGPEGLKGVGEAPAIGTAAAVANAIRAATGVTVHQLPMTPERVWAALQTQGRP